MKKYIIILIFLSSILSSSAQNESEINELDTSLINLIIDFGKTYQGLSYKYGGCSSSTGFDCSGFLYYIFKMGGYALPRRSKDIATIGEQIDMAIVQKGDFLFFNTLNNGGVSHVGIVSEINNKEIIMLHVSSSKGVQEINILKSDYWYDRLVMSKTLF